MDLYDNHPVERMWFGTEQKMGWIETPETGADVSSLGMSADSTLQNGGGNVRNSWDSHKVFQFSWGNSASPNMVSLIQAYRNGSYGRGFLWFHDPMHYSTNLLPKRWADPSMAVNYEAEPLIPDANPTSVPVVSTANNYPINAAAYSVPAGYSSQTNSTEHFIPIPEGMTLLLGAVYAGPAELYVRTLAGVSVISAMSPSVGAVVNTAITGQPWARIGIRNTGGTAAALTITGMSARLSTTVPVGGKTYVNMATNPSFEASSATAELYRNFHANPRLTAGSTGWYASAGTARNAVTIPDRPELSFAWWSAGPVSIAGNRTAATHISGLTIGETYTARITVLAEATGWTLGVWDGTITAPIVITTTPPITSTPLAASSTWREEALTFVAVSSNASIGMHTPVALATSSYGMTAAMVTLASLGPIAFFDGSYSADVDLTPTWTGSDNASASILSGNVVTGTATPAAAARAVRSGRWWSTGSYSLRNIPTGATTGSYTQVTLTGFTTGKKYSISIKLRLPAAQTGVLSANARTIYCGWDVNNKAQAPNEEGVHLLRISVTAVSSSSSFIFYNGSLTTDAWWDDFMIVEDDGQDVPYFDGSTPGAVWNGTPNASTSTYLMPIQGPIGAGPWFSGEGHSGCHFVGNPTVVNYNGVGGGQIGLSAIFSEVGAWA